MPSVGSRCNRYITGDITGGIPYGRGIRAVYRRIVQITVTVTIIRALIVVIGIGIIGRQFVIG